MRPIRYADRTVALCAGDDVLLAPEIAALGPDHPTRRFVSMLCVFSAEVDAGAAPGGVCGYSPAAAERYEDLRQGAEALAQLKPQEIRALLLRAEGYSYAEICEITGWSYAKVNRCLTEGRQALSVRLAGIQGGIECAKLAPLLSALADGEASAEQLARLRPHTDTCLSCRARLKALRVDRQGG